MGVARLVTTYRIASSVQLPIALVDRATRTSTDTRRAMEESMVISLVNRLNDLDMIHSHNQSILYVSGASTYHLNVPRARAFSVSHANHDQVADQNSLNQSTLRQ